ncbi:MAG: hypothetical protein JRH19_09465 [Deltaproteobacteria bacterium]|nr:hypothetical protein [Deltaproteobacteria bacterium]
MFHMLTFFDLETGNSIDEFRASLAEFTAHLGEIDLVQSTGPIGRRQRHEVMDTDGERDHEYYFTLSFRDRAQCDRAVEYVLRHEEPGESLHNAVYSGVSGAPEPIFTCWEDL